MARYKAITLTDEEYGYLDRTIRQGHTTARIQTRGRILLKCADGWTDKTIMEAIEVSQQTVINVRQRYWEGGVMAVLTDKRQEKRRQALTDEQAAHLIAIACSDAPTSHDHWTLRLLAGKAVELGYVTAISPETIRTLLKKTNSSPGNMNNGVFPA